MIDLGFDLEITAKLLLDELEESEVCKSIRKQILGNEKKVPSAHYDTASHVFNSVAEDYYLLGFMSALQIQKLMNTAS